MRIRLPDRTSRPDGKIERLAAKHSIKRTPEGDLADITAPSSLDNAVEYDNKNTTTTTWSARGELVGRASRPVLATTCHEVDGLGTARSMGRRLRSCVLLRRVRGPPACDIAGKSRPGVSGCCCTVKRACAKSRSPLRCTISPLATVLPRTQRQGRRFGDALRRSCVARPACRGSDAGQAGPETPHRDERSGSADPCAHMPTHTRAQTNKRANKQRKTNIQPNNDVVMYVCIYAYM